MLHFYIYRGCQNRNQHDKKHTVCKLKTSIGRMLTWHLVEHDGNIKYEKSNFHGIFRIRNLKFVKSTINKYSIKISPSPR